MAIEDYVEEEMDEDLLKEVGIYKEIFSNGQVRYRQVAVDKTPGVWIPKSDALSQYEGCIEYLKYFKAIKKNPESSKDNCFQALKICENYNLPKVLAENVLSYLKRKPEPFYIAAVTGRERFGVDLLFLFPNSEYESMIELFV